MNDINVRKFSAVIKLILLIFIVAGIPAFLYFKYGSSLFSKDTVEQIISYLRLHRQTAWLIIIGIQIVQVVICFLPGQPIQFASSYMFGVFEGFILSLAGAVLGTIISFYIARLLGRDALRLFFDEEKIIYYQRKLNSGKGLMLTFLIYLIPGVPKDLVSYAAGISEIRFKPFLLMSAIGRSPGMLGSLLLGHMFGKRNFNGMIILSAAVAVILLIFYIKKDFILGYLDRLEEADERRQNTGS